MKNLQAIQNRALEAGRELYGDRLSYSHSDEVKMVTWSQRCMEGLRDGQCMDCLSTWTNLSTWEYGFNADKAVDLSDWCPNGRTVFTAFEQGSTFYTYCGEEHCYYQILLDVDMEWAKAMHQKHGDPELT